MIDLDTLSAARDEAITVFNPWKMEIAMADKIAAGDWEIMWPDRSKEHSDPLVENVYNQALEDKMLAIGTTLPSIFVPPRRGTRQDRAETQAQKRRRVMLSYWDRSNIRRGLTAYARDSLHAGAAYMQPWVNWRLPPGQTQWCEEHGMMCSHTFPEQRYPRMIRPDPRQVYPLAHLPNGELATCLIMRTRRLADIKAEWGKDHPAVLHVDARAHQRSTQLSYVEEIYYYDQQQWAVALMDHNMPPPTQAVSTMHPRPQFGTPLREWLVSPEPHKLFGCPVVEAKRIPTESDDGYKGALFDIIAPLKVAQNFRAMMLDDLVDNIYAPRVIDNVQNPEEYGPGAVLIGTGEGKASIQRDRAPVNFEADQTVERLLGGIRRDAFEPPQRSGEFGASIASAKGVNAVQGTWNAELARTQVDMEYLLERTTALAACMDEVWGPGTKTMEGFDDKKNAYYESYDPRQVFGGDYRVTVSYGDRTGLDQQNHMVFIATASQLGFIPDREAAQRLFPEADVLQWERDKAIEELTELFLKGVLPQMIQQGDLRGFAAMVEAIDDDKLTVRTAAMKVAKDLGMIPANDGSGAPRGPEPDSPDGGQMAAAIAGGAIPGRSDSLPVPGRDLRSVLPSGVQRRIQEAV